MGSTDSSANETSDTEIDERQKVNRRKTQKVEYKPDYETGKIFRGHFSVFLTLSTWNHSVTKKLTIKTKPEPRSVSQSNSRNGSRRQSRQFETIVILRDETTVTETSATTSSSSSESSDSDSSDSDSSESVWIGFCLN